MAKIQPGILLKHDGSLTLAVGRSRKETNWKNQDWTWSQFLTRISTTHRTVETLAEYKKMTKARQDEIKDIGGFVGGTLKEGRRKAGNVAWRQLLTLDADFAKTDLWGLVQIAYDSNAATIYSTHKHCDASPRYRLILPLSRPVLPDEYKAIGHRVAGDLGIDLFDDSTYEPERLMYWPSTSADAPYEFRYQDGEWLDADAVLATYPDWRDPSYWPESSRTRTERKKLADKQGDPLAKPGYIGAFCRTYTIADAIAKFLPDIYTPTEQPDRYSYTKGSTFGGLVVYDDLYAYSHHGTDPAGGKLCNAFDLVRLHRFGDLDDDAKEDTPINRMPSHVAMMELADKDAPTKIELVNTGMAEAAARFGETEGIDEPAAESWKALLTCTKSGAVAPTIENAVIILENDRWLKGRIRLNDFSHKPEITGSLPWRKISKNAATATVWSDSDDSGLRFYLETKYKYSAPAKLNDAIEVILEQNKYHPVRDYLDGLAWDGQPRLDTLLLDWIGADDSAYVRAVTRKVLVAAVARVREPGVKFDYMLTLVGGQGVGKSSLLRKLGMRWFSDSLTTVEGKDAYELLQGYWILEMAELTATKRADIEAIKLFLSKQVDTFRVAYGRRTSEFPRQCVFIGSTNDRSFLKDRTGNRRYWPVTVGHIEPRLGNWSRMTQDYVDQIWAEADQRYKEHEPLWLNTKQLEAESIRLQTEVTEDSGREGIIKEFLDQPLPYGWDSMGVSERRSFLDGFDGNYGEGTEPRQRVCVAEIITECLKIDICKARQTDIREIHEIMRKMPGWIEAGKQRFGKPYGIQRAYDRRPE